MPEFDDATTTSARPEEVWKLLYDPLRFPEWWVGVERVDPGDARGGDADVTIYPDGYPDFPLPQWVESSRGDGRVTVSCAVSNLVFRFLLAEDPGGGTRVDVHVELPPEEAAREPRQRDVVRRSLARLTALAEAG